MADDEITYDVVIDVWERERDATMPCALPDNFYERLRGYIQELEEKTEDISPLPKNKRERMVQKQYERVIKIAEHFFKERQKKIVLAAYHRSLGEEVDTDNLLDRELELLDEISSHLKELKNLMFYGEYKRKTGSEFKEEKKLVEEVESTEDDEGDGDIEVAETRSAEKQPGDVEGLGSDVEAHEELLVYIMEDVPPFVDVDNTYKLIKEDVITLQEDIARVLIERGKARKVKL